MIDINQEYTDMGWDDVVGLSVIPVLAEWQGAIPRTVLFHGPYGCGKNLLAYLFAKKLPNVEITVRNTVDNTAKGAEAMIAQFSAPSLQISGRTHRENGRTYCKPPLNVHTSLYVPTSRRRLCMMLIIDLGLELKLHFLMKLTLIP
jgi:hypothetical protein